MNNDLIGEIAGQVGLGGWCGVLMNESGVRRFAALVAEECAKICDVYAAEAQGFTEEEFAAKEMASKIRSKFIGGE